MILSDGVGRPDVGHRLADLERELELGAGEALRRVLEAQAGARGDERRGSSRFSCSTARTAISTISLLRQVEDILALARARSSCRGGR